MKTGVIVTTKDRFKCLERSLPQIARAAAQVNAAVLLVDDGSSYNPDRVAELCSNCARDVIRVDHLEIPQNRGLACALNIGLSYFLADPDIKSIHYFQDDVEVDHLAIAACNEIIGFFPAHCVTGHDAEEHRAKGDAPCIPSGFPVVMNGIEPRRRESCRATHMAASDIAWRSVMPIRSRGLGLPSRQIRDPKNPEARGTGSGVDWWIVRDSPHKLPVLCVPRLVRTFAWKKTDSTWDNEQIAGEDPPLSRAAIQEWANARSS